MCSPELVYKNTENCRRALILGEEARISELVSLILEDLGFKSMQICQVEWLAETTGHIKPELIIWDLSSEKKLSPFQSFYELREKISMENVKIMFLSEPGMKNDLKVPKGDTEVHFCMKPFSPGKLRQAIEQLYGGKSNG
jgi:DNA-binding response OmpR family regulator